MHRKKLAVQFRHGETPRQNPKAGFFGFLGLLGFLGIVTYRMNGTVFPFFFFSFFGFFGYFFSAKTSGSFRDERYEENLLLAERNSYRLGFRLSFVAVLICCFDRPFSTSAGKSLFLVISMSLIIGAVIFLREYLLFRYDIGFSEEE